MKSKELLKDVEKIYGCPFHQVLKTLLFIGKKSVIVVLPGDRKANFQKLKEIAKDESLRLATPDEVKEITGYTVGKLPPFVLKNDVVKILDKSVLEIDVVNIRSGKVEIGIELASSELKKVWDGIVEDISSFFRKKKQKTMAEPPLKNYTHDDFDFSDFVRTLH